MVVLRTENAVPHNMVVMSNTVMPTKFFTRTVLSFAISYIMTIDRVFVYRFGIKKFYFLLSRTPWRPYARSAGAGSWHSVLTTILLHSSKPDI